MMAELLNDDKASGNAKAASVRIGSDTVGGYSRQRRHDLRIGPQPGYVDPGRAPLNRVLIEYPRPAEMRRIAVERRAIRETSRAMKSNAAIATVGVITFGSEAAQIFERLSSDQQDAAFRELAEAVASRLQTSIHGLTVHLDESTIHAHFVMASYDHAGNPISQTTRPQILSELQDLTAEVMQRYCPEIERGTRYGDRLAAGANFADVIHKSVAQLHRTLPADLAAKRAEVDQAKDDALKAQARVNEMQARVDKLTAKEADLTAKETKNLAIYVKRLADRNAEVEEAQKKLDNTKAEVERLNGIASLAREAAEKSEADRQQAEEQARGVLDQSAVEVEAARIASEDLAQQKIKAAEAQAATIREKMAAEADAATAAFRALAIQIRDGTVSQDEKGKIVSENNSALRPGGPLLVETARVVLPLISEAKIAKDAALKSQEAAAADRLSAEADRVVAAKERHEAVSIRQMLSGLLDRLQKFLTSPGLSKYAKVHQEGTTLFREIRQGVKDLKPDFSSDTPKKTVKEPSSDDGLNGP